MATTLDLLSQVSMTAALNNVKSPNAFLQRLLWGNHEVLGTETIELSTLEGGREMAPFIQKNGEAVHIGGVSETFATVTAPNIRMKRTLDAATKAFKRGPTGRIFVGGREVRSALQAAVARDIAYMDTLITNNIEWQASQAMTGVIAYTDVDEKASFKVTYPKPAANEATTGLTASPATDGAAWDSDNQARVFIELDFLDAKEVMSEGDAGVVPTDCIMSRNPAMAFMKSAAVQKLISTDNVQAGGITFLEQFSADGVIFLGTFSGVRCWMYIREIATPAGGAATKLIREDYVEFVSTQATDSNVLYFAAIPEVDDNDNITVFEGEKFSKGWVRKDPPSITGLVASRPLAVPRRPSAFYSLKCTNVT
jgi:hypothetical protein